MQLLYAILVGLAVWLVGRLFLPRAFDWFFGLWVPSDKALEKAAAKADEAHRRAEHDPAAARRLLAEKRKLLRLVAQSVGRNPDEPATIRDMRVQALADVKAEVQELERQLVAKGWLTRTWPAEPVVHGQYDWETFKEDLGFALMIAGTYGLIAAVPLGLFELYGIVMHLVGSPEAPPVRTMIGFPVIVLVGYAVAAVGTALAVFLLRPLRRWALGWMLSGSVVAVMVYGGVGLVAALGYLWFGINIIDFESREEVWKVQLFVMGLVALVGAPAGLYFRSEEEGEG